MSLMVFDVKNSMNEVVDPVMEDVDDSRVSLWSTMQGSPLRNKGKGPLIAHTSSSKLFPLASSRADSTSPNRRGDLIDKLVKLKVKDSKIAPLLGKETLVEKQFTERNLKKLSKMKKSAANIEID